MTKVVPKPIEILAGCVVCGQVKTCMEMVVGVVPVEKTDPLLAKPLTPYEANVIINKLDPVRMAVCSGCSQVAIEKVKEILGKNCPEAQFTVRDFRYPKDQAN